jgi:hypothetical protein
MGWEGWFCWTALDWERRMERYPSHLALALAWNIIMEIWELGHGSMNLDLEDIKSCLFDLKV